MYAGETAESYNNYHYSNNKMTIFADKNRSRDDVILGIESSFDESAASFVNSFGEIKANHQITQWEQWRDTDGIDPKVAEEKHKENVPKAIEECLKQYSIKKGDSRFKGIAVTVGPGQEKSLNVAINLAQVN
jgi:N6-L-threonylcarbamoyladenine synthase